MLWYRPQRISHLRDFNTCSQWKWEFLCNSHKSLIILQVWYLSNYLQYDQKEVVQTKCVKCDFWQISLKKRNPKDSSGKKVKKPLFTWLSLILKHIDNDWKKDTKYVSLNFDARTEWVWIFRSFNDHRTMKASKKLRYFHKIEENKTWRKLHMRG